MNQALLENPNVQDCCKQAENRIAHVEPGMAQRVSCEKCQVCGRRHFTMLVDPLDLRGEMT